MRTNFSWRKRVFRLICLGVALLLMSAGCSSEEAPTRHDDFTPLTSIVIVADAPSIAARTSTKLSVIGNFSGQFTRDITDRVVWSSSSPTVAGFITSVSPNRVTGHLPGTALLTATVGSVSATFDLTVTSATVTALTISPDAATIPKGRTTQFTVNGTFSDATTQDITFDATWATSDPNVASVSDAASSKGFTQALAVGTSTVTATFDGVSGASLLTVTEVVLQSITVSPANSTVVSLSSKSFQAAGHYSDGSTADITGQVAWASSQPGTATISSGGVAKTLVPGTTSIGATLTGVSGSSNLKVTGGNLTGITLFPANPRLVIGTIGQMTATGSFSNGSSRDITGVVDWSVASTIVANVTTPGGNQALLNALVATPASAPLQVTATSGTVTASTNLTVAAPLLQSIAISAPSLDLTVGTSRRFTATATFNDGTTQDVTGSADWTSGVSTAASVDNTGLAKGRVHGVAAVAGPVTIRATFGGFTDTAPVTVKTRTIVTLAVSNASAVTVGNQVKFTATATYSDASSQVVTEDATWTIDNATVAILADSQNQPGQVVGVDSGSATLTATLSGKTQSVILTVP